MALADMIPAMSYWLLKTEPSDYSWDDLVRDGRTVWDGVANNTALIHLRQAKKGDRALIYHTGDEKAAVGVADVVSAPYADPREDDPKLAVFDVAPRERLPRPVTLAELKANPDFADFELIRNSRLSAMPVSPERWKKILALAKKQRRVHAGP
jgi:predicted RNA-binding protein with PUA-like domain